MANTRDYYYDVDVRGELTLDGVVQDDSEFLDFFYRRLAPTANPFYPEYPYVSRCGDEMNYLRPADTPIVFTSFDGERLYYGGTLSVPFYPDRLSYSDDGVLYYAAPVGQRGRIVPPVAVEIAAAVQPWGPFYAYRHPVRGNLIPFLPTTNAEHLHVLYPRPNHLCVGCSTDNPHGLGLSFIYDKRNDEIVTYVVPDERMQGALYTTHGGFVSLLLDETMGKCLTVRGIRAPTAQLTVHFRKPMLLGREHEIRARVIRQTGRANMLQAAIRATDDASLIAEADAVFITIGSTDSAPLHRE